MRTMRARNMTEGNLLTEIIRFALPVALGLLFQQFYNLADTVIVGRMLGVEALAGVGSTTGLTFFTFSISTGLGNGFAVSISQRFGADDISGVKTRFGNAILIAGMLAMIFTVLTTLSAGPILSFAKTPIEIYSYAFDYVIIIFSGLACTIFYNLFASALRAIGDSRTPVTAIIISSAINIVLDILLIGKAKMGVAGAALATVIAQLFAAVFLLGFIMRKNTVLKIARNDLRLTERISKEQLKTAFPMALQGMVIALGISIVQTAINSMGTVYVAGCTAGNKLYGMMAAPVEAVCQAMVPISAQNYGAGKYGRIREGLKTVVVMGWILTVLLILVAYFLGPGMMELFIDGANTAVIAYGHRFLLFYVCGYGFLTIQMSFCYTLQGCGFAEKTVLSGVLETAGRIFGAIILTNIMGYAGICLALPLAWIFTSVYLIPTYYYCRKNMHTT